MAAIEDLDLDTLTHLMEDEDFDNEICSPSLQLPNSFIQNETSLSITNSTLLKTNIEKNQEISQTNITSETLTKSKKLNDISVDLFSIETNSNKVKNDCISIEKSLVHSEEIDSSDEEINYLTENGKNIKKNLIKLTNYQAQTKKVVKTWKDRKSNEGIKNPQNESFITENYSGIRIVNPLISFDLMQQRMQGRKMIKMSLIQRFIRGSDIEGDWVTIGVIVGKTPPKNSKTGKAFSIWKMTDLLDPEKIVNVFLFGAAHAERWKTAIGTVAGILNPSIMPDKDKSGLQSLSVDHAGKIMIMGTSKDFGHCKARRKDGTSCTSIVNLSQCDVCSYHVKNEYKKLSSKRIDIQASYSGREPSFKNRILKGQNIFYGGQMFSPLSEKKQPKKCNSKDRLTLSNLSLKRKAEHIENEENAKLQKLENEERVLAMKKLENMYGTEVVKVVKNTSEFVNQQLTIPSVGSRNLLQHFMKDVEEKTKPDKIISIKPKELLKQQKKLFEEQQKNQLSHNSNKLTIQNLMPQLGKGLHPGQKFSLESYSPVQNHFRPQDIAKLKAIKKIKENGSIKPKDPNSVKVSSDSIKKGLPSLNSSCEEEKITSNETNEQTSKSILGTIDLNSNRIQEILNRKSNHAHEVEMGEIEKEEAYFKTLEKKEQMEQKMSTTTEIVCDVVSCKQCKYTAHQATDICKEQNHLLKFHKALKRFFCCKDCNRRTCAFTKFPTKACRNCGGSNFERTSMMKPRSGPKLDSEILLIRGEETKYLNSLKSTCVF